MTSLMDPAVAFSLRSGISEAAGTIVDATFIASIHELSSGLVRVFTATSPINTVGNIYNTTDEFIETVEAISAGTKSSPSPKALQRALQIDSRSTSRRSLSSSDSISTVVGKNAVERPLPVGDIDAELSLFHESDSIARRLDLTLSPEGFVQTEPDAENTAVRVSVNVVMRSQALAEVTKAALLESSNFSYYLIQTSLLIYANMTGADAAMAARRLINATDTQGGVVALNADSIKVVELQYTKSFWMLVWEWILANIRRVVGISCALIVVSFAISWFKGYRARQRELVLEKLAAKRDGILAGTFVAEEESAGNESVEQHPLLNSARKAPSVAAANSEAKTMRSRLKALLDPHVRADRTPLTQRALAAWQLSKGVSSSDADGGLNLGYGGSVGSSSENPTVLPNDSTSPPPSVTRIGVPPSLSGSFLRAPQVSLGSPLSVAKAGQTGHRFGHDALEAFVATANQDALPGAPLTAASSQLIMPSPAGASAAPPRSAVKTPGSGSSSLPKGFRGAGAAIVRARGHS